jgi:peroxidase
LLLLALAGTSSAQLSTSFYASSCPGVYGAVRSVVRSAIAKENRMGASILRLFFHDCFVQVRTDHRSSCTIPTNYMHDRV